MNGQTAEIVCIGNAPGLVQGIVQMNLRLPTPLPPNLYRLLYPGTAEVDMVYPDPTAKNAGGRIWIR